MSPEDFQAGIEAVEEALKRDPNLSKAGHFVLGLLEYWRVRDLKEMARLLGSDADRFGEKTTIGGVLRSASVTFANAADELRAVRPWRE